MKTVLVFKTSVETPEEEACLKPVLDSLFQFPERWNFDLQDWENILRIESNSCSPKIVIQALNTVGYYCEELED